MDVHYGDIVECKGNISAPWFSVGHFYAVFSDKTLVDDNGNSRVPSARFKLHMKREEYYES